VQERHSASGVPGFTELLMPTLDARGNGRPTIGDSCSVTLSSLGGRTRIAGALLGVVGPMKFDV
jgi:hypothetical protein